MDARIAKILGDGRSTQNQEARRFRRDLLEHYGNKRKQVHDDFLISISKNYGLMITLWSFIEGGEIKYLDEYLKLQASIQKALMSLQMPGKHGRESPGTGKSIETDLP